MATTQINFAIVLTITFIVTATAAEGMQEFCQWETFEAKCQEDEVIMIKEAHYGRMRVGRCMPTNSGFVGCSADVSSIMHKRCSGRQSCTVPVPDPTMFAATSCPKDLVSYLQTDYECIKVAKASSDICDDQILTALSGDIAKPLTDSKSICPHRILAQPGQTVNVYLYDFYNTDSNTKPMSDCITYGHISEGSKTPTHLCGGDFKKNHLIYSSDSNIVDIMLAHKSSHSQHFVLRYKIVGCPNLTAPKNAWVKIQDNTAVITCNYSSIASTVVCSNNKWVGDLENCTTVRADMLVADQVSVTSISDIFASSGAFTIACVGVSAGVLFSLGLLMLVKARHLKAKQISELPQTCEGEKHSLVQKEKAFKLVDPYQPVYMPLSMDSQYASVHQSRPAALSPHHLMVTDYATTLDTCIPITQQSTYGPLRTDQKVPVYSCSHHIYDLAALSHTLGREKIVSIEEDVLY